jgi:hypothetical protein
VTQLNRRDEQIAALKRSTDKLDRDRLDECYREIVRGYEAATIVDGVAHVVELTDRTPSDFRVLTNSEARRLAHFNARDYYWDLYCEQLGRSIALGEMRYLFERAAQLPASGLTINAENPNFGPILEAIRRLTSLGHKADVLFAPISMFMPFNTGRELRIDWQARPRESLVTPSGQMVEIFWSGGISPLDRFVLLESRAGVWSVKLDPDTGRRLTVAIGRAESLPDAVMFLAETVVNYEIEDPEAFCVIELEGQPRNDLGETSTKAQ